MLPRKRVQTALEHREPDRVPLDEPCGSFRMDTWKQLEHRLAGRDHEAIKDQLGIDFRTIGLGPSKEFMKEAKTVFPVGLLKPLANGLFADEWGIQYEIVSTGTHTRYAKHPLEDVDDLSDFELPDLDAPGRWDKVESRIRKWKRDYFVVGAMWTTLFEISWALRGFGRFIKDLYSDSRFADSLLDRLLEYRLETGKRFTDLGVDMVHLGDDFGTQKNLLLSLDVWRRHFKPRMKTLIESLRNRGRVYIMYHSDGNIEKLIPELIEIGVEVLNPIQPECMDPAVIKDRYGEKLTLHGTMSIQRTLPFGTKEDVRTEAITRIKTCGPGGGLVLAPSHAPQPDVPVENIITLYETAKNTPYSSLASLQ